MKYDDASWHYNGTFPEDSPQEYGGTHMALFLKWCFIRGFAGDLHLEEEPESVNAVINGSMKASDFFFEFCDGKLTDEDFNDVGNEFASVYYGEDGKYLEDYSNNFGDQMYVDSEELHDFQKFSVMIDKRWTEWSSPKVLTEKKWFHKLLGKR